MIAVEDLAVQNMVRNRRLARASSDCGWGAFRAMLEYKAARAGRRVIVIDRWYPSSKRCSACEAATTVRSGPVASIFPVVYHDLVRWIDERGYHLVAGPGREVWLNEVDDIADVAQQVFEIQLPFTRTGGPR